MFHSNGFLHAVVDKGLVLRLSDDIELQLNCSNEVSNVRGNNFQDSKIGKVSINELEKEDQPLRLHQFVCNAFRPELNVAENGAGELSKRLQYKMILTE
jgi:hypothetical protein